MSIAGTGSLPLGIVDDSTGYMEDAVQLQPGDLLLFYSDGITEARSPQGEFFGVDRLDRTLRELPANATPDEAVGAVEEALRGFSGSGAPGDDQALLAVRWHPAREATTGVGDGNEPTRRSLHSEACSSHTVLTAARQPRRTSPGSECSFSAAGSGAPTPPDGLVEC
jgi:hypothetical protein